ncbi:TPA: hypothetical protein DDW35_08445, partial [Candidatus Sumerlaeota bacterium]|nr:hypothetical protein [Candidatus Sumerlaeota bacterium]
MNLTDLAQHLSQSGGHSLDEEGLLRFILSEELLKPLHQKIVSFSSSISPEDAQTVESVYQTCLHAGSVVGRQVHLLRLYLDKESHELVYCAVLDQFNTLTIGRGRDVGLFLNHHSVSRNHCRISRSNDSILVEDLGATNTTLVNQKKISTPVPLHANDRIDIGEIQLRIHFDIPAKKTGSDVVQENHLLSKAKSRDALSSAYPEQRTIFNTVLGNTPNKYSQRLADRKRINILLDGQPITIGRSKELSNIQLDDNMVSHRHARLRKETNGYIIEDLNSTNGIYLNGERIHREAPIHKGDLIVIGPYRLRHEGDFLTSTRKEIGAQVTINNLGKRVISREEGKPLWLLKDVSLSIHPAEFVGLMGAAGCGKSTFMDAINGRRPATNGTVLYDGQDLYQAFESVKSDIGYVPQQVILHEDLPLIDVLNYSSRLRLPSDISQDEIETNIRMALEKVGLQNREKTRIR